MSVLWERDERNIQVAIYVPLIRGAGALHSVGLPERVQADPPTSLHQLPAYLVFTYQTSNHIRLHPDH